MEDKLIEDFDVDFINDILGPSDLQMADNLIHDIMHEYQNSSSNVSTSNSFLSNQIINQFHDSNNTSNNNRNTNNNNAPIASTNNSNIYHHNCLNISTQNFPIMQHAISSPMISPNDHNNNSFINPSMITPEFNQVIITQQQNYVPTQASTICQSDVIPASNKHSIQHEASYSDAKRARKNLKDILKENSNTNSNTLILNQQDKILVNNGFQIPLLAPQNTVALASNDSLFQSSNIQLVIPSCLPNLNDATANNGPVQSLMQMLDVNPSKHNETKSTNSKKVKSEIKLNINTKENEKPLILTAKRNKISKRTSHNAIEKKYRSSINDKIIELKNRVAGPNIKLQKSGILRKALEYITNIEEENKTLSHVNSLYRTALQTIELNSTNLTLVQSVIQQLSTQISLVNKEKYNKSSQKYAYAMPNTPPSSSPSDGDSRFSSTDSDTLISYASPSSNRSASVSPKPHEAKRSYNKKAKQEPMNDSSRIMLCMVVMSVLFFNPFGLLISSSSSSQAIGSTMSAYESAGQHLNSRVLNWFNTREENQSIVREKNETNSFFDLKHTISWTLNILLVFFCLFKIYSKSEPSLDLSDQKNAQNLWLFYQKASKSFQKKDFEESYAHLSKALRELGQNAPKTKFQLISGILWQMIRLCLNKIKLGRYFSRINIWLYGEKNTLKVNKLCALFHYEMAKFAYSNLNSPNDLNPKTIVKEKLIKLNLTTYSYLFSFYYMLAMFNMCDLYSKQEYEAEMTPRDEFNLCEFYASLCVYLNLFVPSRLSRSLIKYILRKKLASQIELSKFDDEADEANSLNRTCKLDSIKSLLKKNLFTNFVINFEHFSNFASNKYGHDDSLANRQQVLNFILFKRKLLNQESFLYQSDDSVSNFEIANTNQKHKLVNIKNGVASSFILEKFKDFVLYKMTNHVLNNSNMIKINGLLNSNSILKAKMKEEADLDSVKFEKLKLLYKKNLQSLSVDNETHAILIEFLDLLNNWKLGNFDHKINRSFENESNSLFIEAVLNVFKAYEIISNDCEKALVHCKKSNDCLANFSTQISVHSTNYYLIEKFELLIYDWNLSAQTFIWTKNQKFDLDLYNECLSKYQSLVGNHPSLNQKAKMYEIVMLYSTNRNPIGLLNATLKQATISKSNQDTIFSINKILKKFHLQFN